MPRLGVVAALVFALAACGSASAPDHQPLEVRAEVEQPDDALPAPSIAAAQAELARAAGLSGDARLRALARARALLEGVTGSRAEPVVLRAPYLLPALAPLQTAALAGTSFTVAGVAALEVPGGALVVEGDRLVRYGPEPTTVIESGAAWPLSITPHGVKTGFGSSARFADLASDPPREMSVDDLTFYLPDGAKRTVESTNKEVRLILPSGPPVVLETKGNMVAIDDVTSRIITYWPLGSTGPGDPHTFELSVFDAKDGRRLVHASGPPTDAFAPPRLSVSADAKKLVGTSANTTAVLTFATGAWKSVGSYDLEFLGGGALDSAFTSDGAHLCAAWQDNFHVIPNDLPRNSDAFCEFEPRSAFHRDARIGCVEREQGWVPTRSSARPVNVRGAAMATRARKIAMLQNAAGVDPLPGGLVTGPQVAVRIVIANADTCKIERRIPLGRRGLSNDATVEISADASIVALSGEAFDTETGKPTQWAPNGMPPEPDHSYRDASNLERDSRCRFGAVLAPIELCPAPLTAAAIDAALAAPH